MRKRQILTFVLSLCLVAGNVSYATASDGTDVGTQVIAGSGEETETETSLSSELLTEGESETETETETESETETEASADTMEFSSESGLEEDLDEAANTLAGVTADGAAVSGIRNSSENGIALTASNEETGNETAVSYVAEVDGTFYTSLAAALAAAANGATVTMLADTTEDITIASGMTITLDLNGCTLTGTGTGSVITVNGTLTLTDSDGSGKVTGGSATSGGGVYVAKSASFTLNGGTITGNYATNGGGVYVNSQATFTLNGGTITGNTAKNNGGGVYAAGSSSTVQIAGGTISDNTASYGGGVYSGGTLTVSGGTISGNTANNYGGGISIGTSGTLTVSGGEISDNTATSGGGVYLYNKATLTMSGGTISGNTASNGGGLYAAGATGTILISGGTITENAASVEGGGTRTLRTISVSGSPVISGNTGSTGEEENVYLSSAQTITIVGNLTDGADIGVTKNVELEEGETAQIATGGDSDSLKYFSSDNTENKISVDSSGNVQLCGLPDITGSVTISGDAEYGQTLTANLVEVPDGFSDGAVYQWLRDGKKIEDATSSATYTLTADDVGCIITVVVTHSDYAGKLTASTDDEVQSVILTAMISGTTTKTYDGTKKVTNSQGLTVTLEGILDGDDDYVSVSDGVSFAYDSAEAGKRTITAGNIALVGDHAKGYTLAATTVTTDGRIQKAVPSFTLPTNLTAAYGQTLADVELPEGWSWVEETTGVGDVGTSSFRAVYTPDDTTNYSTVYATLTVTVEVAELTEDMFTVDTDAETYTGSEITKAVTSSTLTEGTDYTISYSDNSNVGTATITITGMGNYSGTVTYEFTIDKAAQDISYKTDSVSKTVGDAAFTNALTQTVVYGTISYESSDTSVATVDSDGQVTIVGAGTATITATASGSDNYTEATASYTVTVAAAADSGDSGSGTETESETTATESETTATESETTATESETTATESETTATESETTATESETTAIESETTATESETAATESETTATESETTATESETTATETETATESETTATESETTATESETTATESETETETETTPQTGDNTPVEMWLVLMLLSAAAVILLFGRRRAE